LSKDSVNVKLIASDRMDAAGGREDSYVRIPSRARKFIKSKADKITMAYGKKAVALDIKNCYKEDILAMKSDVADGTLSKAEARCVGYVTTRTLNKLIGKKKNVGYCNLSNTIEDITIGADPEFVLVHPRSLSYKYADRVEGFPRAGVLGSDGPLAEVRPPPSTSIDGIIKNIRSILRKGNQSTIGPYLWFAGATYH